MSMGELTAAMQGDCDADFMSMTDRLHDGWCFCFFCWRKPFGTRWGLGCDYCILILEAGFLIMPNIQLLYAQAVAICSCCEFPQGALFHGINGSTASLVSFLQASQNRAAVPAIDS